MASLVTLPPATAYTTNHESYKVLLSRRLASWAQLREAHTGQSYWYNTILITRKDLAGSFDKSRMKIRTTRLAILGMSLSAVLDIHTAKDFLKALQSLVQEFDNVQDDRFERRNRGGTFRAVGVGRPKRQTLGSSELSVGLQEGDATYLMTPNIPFELDYFQVAITACDVVMQVYERMSAFVDPKAAQSTFPVPPVPFSPASYTSFERATGSLGPGSLDSILKIDNKLSKTLGAMMKDFDALARRLVKNEIEQLSGTNAMSILV